MKKNNLKLILLILFLVSIIGGIALWNGIIRHKRNVNLKQVKISGIFLPKAENNILPFELKTTKNRIFTADSLKGNWTMMFFGFTNCGFVCPTTMAALNKMYRHLQEVLPDRQLPKIVMVSVDPDRDSLKRLGEYLKSFNINFIGARADISETVKLEKQLHIAAAKIKVNGKGKNHYTVDHTSDILLFNPKGQLQAYLSWPHDPEVMSKDYITILRAIQA